MAKKVVVTAMSAAGKTFARAESSFCDVWMTKRRQKFLVVRRWLLVLGSRCQFSLIAKPSLRPVDRTDNCGKPSRL
jgi:hypothetical protein